MEKSCHSSADSSTSSGGGRTDLYLRQLNKSSVKISKPSVLKKPSSETPSAQTTVSSSSAAAPAAEPAASQTQPVHQQPPVYNINKNDFRDVVQRLTGSPAHERVVTPPPPVHQPKPQSSRLQRIRPPPLASLAAARPPAPAVPPVFSQRPRSPAPPFSPLPPFPPVSATAESPISAYMRYLQGSAATPGGGGQGFFPPNSPVGVGPVISPFPMLSPGFLFSPTGYLGFPGLPASPRLPMPSPRWRDL